MDSSQIISSTHLSSLPKPSAPGLSEQPLIKIRPGKKWVALNLRDLWAYRELLYFLTLRDVKVRYKQTLLGASWIILQPVLTMVIFTLLFGRVMKVPSDGIPYPLFAFAVGLKRDCVVVGKPTRPPVSSGTSSKLRDIPAI